MIPWGQPAGSWTFPPLNPQPPTQTSRSFGSSSPKQSSTKPTSARQPSQPTGSSMPPLEEESIGSTTTLSINIPAATGLDKTSTAPTEEQDIITTTATNLTKRVFRVAESQVSLRLMHWVHRVAFPCSNIQRIQSASAR
ncbi:hypothetical protein O1611_g8343 [Lasiodiplodia mahajangana]|uniref:Uncharacterized protein n=1 Tax=Lasiodiplodia mahajangana TaxID=1108764 RepID=A0ACC2JD29_9PEZI|nr:hypothetical protein O1611_g8343 [Lasiodiplodia mahajangana]